MCHETIYQSANHLWVRHTAVKAMLDAQGHHGATVGWFSLRVQLGAIPQWPHDSPGLQQPPCKLVHAHPCLFMRI